MSVIKINFITYNNGYGLSNDMKLLQKRLTKLYNNIEIFFCNYYDHNIPNANINIFFEVISNLLIPKANYNILIPNQEWFYKTWVPYLKDIDLILVKTKYAENIFKNFGKVEYIGWESKDMEIKGMKKNFKKFIHICGKSNYKQTDEIIENWKPEYPHLEVLFNDSKIDNSKWKKQKNITFINKILTHEELKDKMNSSGIHICCSLAEGFGHYINEARSSSSVVVTTNAEPMNDFIKNI